MTVASRHGDTSSPTGVRGGEISRRPGLRTRVLLALCAWACGAAARAVEPRELLAVPVDRGDVGRPVVTLPCALDEGVDIADLGVVNGSESPEERVGALLDVLARIDPQRADAFRRGLDALPTERRFVEGKSLGAALAESGLVSGPEALTTLLASRAPASAPPGMALEALSARVPGDQPGSSVLLVDAALWGSLGHGRQAALLFLQLAAGESEALADRTLPCALLSVVSSPTASSMTLSQFYQEMARRRRVAAPPSELAPASEEVRRPVRFDVLFNPLDRLPEPESARKIVGGYEIRPVGLIGWGARAELGFTSEDAAGTRTADDVATLRESVRESLYAGADFEGYFHHPKIVRWGATVAVLVDVGEAETETAGAARSSDATRIKPQLGFSAIALRDQPTSFSASYNHYRTDIEAGDDDYTVTDTTAWTLGAKLGFKPIPTRIRVAGDNTEQEDRGRGEMRRSERLWAQLDAEHAAGISRTDLRLTWEAVDEARARAADGEVATFRSSREGQEAEIANELQLRGGKDRLDSAAYYDAQSGALDSARLLSRQSWHVRHSDTVSGTYGWEDERMTFSRGDGEPEQETEARQFLGHVAWKPTAGLSVDGAVERDDRTGNGYRHAGLGARAAARWSRRFEHVHLGVSVGVDWGTDEEDGVSGTVSVIDEAHRLAGEKAERLEHPDVDPSSLFVTSEDGVLSYEPDIDYSVIERGGYLEIARIDTGTIPDGAVVRVDYVRALVLKAPLSYDRTEVGCAVSAGLFGRVQVGLRWSDTAFDAQDREDAGTRLDDVTRIFANASGRVGVVDLTASHEDYRQASSGFTEDRIEARAQWQVGLRHWISAAADWTSRDFEVGGDYSSMGASVTYSVTPGRRWPTFRLSGGYHPFDATDYEGEPYEARLEMLYTLGRFDLSLDYRRDKQVSQRDVRERQWLELVLRASW